MGSPPPKLPELLSTAAPAIAAAAALLQGVATDHAKARRENDAERLLLAKERANLTQRAKELDRKERSLARSLELLAAQTARTTQPAPSGTRRLFERNTTPAPPVRLPIWELDEHRQPRLVTPERISFVWCVEFYRAPRAVQEQVSHARRSQYRRIGRIPYHVGIELDQAGTSFHALRFVAYAEGAYDQQRRAAGILRGERPPRQMHAPSAAEASLTTKKKPKRGRGRPAHAPKQGSAAARRSLETPNDPPAEEAPTDINVFRAFAQTLLDGLEKAYDEESGADEESDDAL